MNSLLSRNFQANQVVNIFTTQVGKQTPVILNDQEKSLIQHPSTSKPKSCCKINIFGIFKSRREYLNVYYLNHIDHLPNLLKIFSGIIFQR